MKELLVDTGTVEQNSFHHTMESDLIYFLTFDPRPSIYNELLAAASITSEIKEVIYKPIQMPYSNP